MPKRMLVVTDVMSRGGVDTYTIDLVRMGLEKGWEIEVSVDQLTMSSIPEALHSFCTVHQGPLYHRQNPVSKIEEFYESILQKTAPNLVHFSCGTPGAGLRVREITLGRHIPLLFTEHYIPPDLDADIIERLTQLYDQAQGIIHVSEDNYTRLYCLLPSLKKENVYIIPNGIDLKNLQQASLSSHERVQTLKNRLLKKEKLRLLSACRLTGQKGIDLLIQAIAHLKEEYRQKLLLDVWGEGPEGFSLQKNVQNLTIKNIVNFHPWAKDFLSLFRAYDLFIFPSRNEGLPFTLLEALASGISIITSDIPVHRWICREGQYATLFQSESVESLTHALEAWVKNPIKNDLDYSNTHEWLSRHFEKNKNMKKTLHICDSII